MTCSSRTQDRLRLYAAELDEVSSLGVPTVLADLADLLDDVIACGECVTLDDLLRLLDQMDTEPCTTS